MRPVCGAGFCGSWSSLLGSLCSWSCHGNNQGSKQKSSGESNTGVTGISDQRSAGGNDGRSGKSPGIPQGGRRSVSQQFPDAVSGRYSGMQSGETCMY